MPFENIQTDPDICSNCFRRTHGRYERNYRLDTYFDDEEGEWSVRPVDVQGVEIEVHGETEIIGGEDDEVYRNRDDTMKIPERGAIRGMRTVCKCGFRYTPDRLLEEGETWKYRPLPKATFFEYAEHLVDRLEEKGVDFCEETFYDTLDRLKSDPDEQFADDRLYEKACKQASSVETARTSVNAD